MKGMEREAFSKYERRREVENAAERKGRPVASRSQKRNVRSFSPAGRKLGRRGEEIARKEEREKEKTRPQHFSPKRRKERALPASAQQKGERIVSRSTFAF